MKNFKDIKIGDKFIHTAFNKVDVYGKPIHTHATKLKNVVEVVMINENTPCQNHIDQLVLKYINGSGHVQVYDYLNDHVFNDTFDEWLDIELNEYNIIKSLDNGLIFISRINNEYYTKGENAKYYKVIGRLHHDYDPNSGKDEFSISEV